MKSKKDLENMGDRVGWKMEGEVKKAQRTERYLKMPSRFINRREQQQGAQGKFLPRLDHFTAVGAFGECQAMDEAHRIIYPASRYRDAAFASGHGGLKGD